jgi:hypothetical protein
MVVAGCATIEPFAQFVPLGQPDASRITIEAKFLSGMKFGDDAPFGRVFVNSQFQGTFLKSQKVFSKEIPPGPLTLSVCAPTNECVTQVLTIKPNTHLYFDYTSEWLILSNQWRLALVRTENYSPVSKSNSQIIKNVQDSGATNQNSKSNELDKLDAMKAAREKCLSLGFKLSSDEFGKCILTLSK